MARQKKSKLKDIIVWLLLLLLLTGGIGAAVYFSGISKDDIITAPFSVEYDGNVYKTDAENVLDLPKSGQARFEVKGAKSYGLSIVPNVTTATDFDYIANGNKYPFNGEKDLTKAFEIERYDNYFILECGVEYSLESVLSKIWGTDNITITDYVITNPYKIVLVSSSGKKIEIAFGGLFTNITTPILDTTEIVF